MSLAAGTYRGRLGGQLYQADAPQGVRGLGALRLAGHGADPTYVETGMTKDPYGVERVAVFGRTKMLYSLRQRSEISERNELVMARAQAREQFESGQRVGTVMKAVGLGGLAGALLAAALL